MKGEELIKKANLQKISAEGTRIYEQIKTKYEPQHTGRFLAIEVDEEKAYLGDSSSEAVELARQTHPDKVFYVVKIGHSTAETLASLRAAR